MTETEGPVRKALERWLSPIFTDKAKDVDLRFFADESDVLRHQIQEVINDNRTSYTIRLPKENYMHLAVANIADDRQVRLSEVEHSKTMMLRLPEEDDIHPLRTGVFSARLPMEVTDTTTRFDVKMYMVSSAVALVMDTTACADLLNLDCYMSGGACGFTIRDSIFAYDNRCRMNMERVAVDKVSSQQPSVHRVQHSAFGNQPYACLATVCFPTEDDKQWTVTVRATLTNNRHTTTTLTIEEPLKAGTLRVISCALTDKGEVDPEPEHDQEVGATVEMDWKEGSTIIIEL